MRDRVHNVARLPQVFLLQQAVSDSAHIGGFKRKTVSQFALEGHVEAVGVGRPEPVIQAPLHREVGQGELGGKTCARRWRDQRWRQGVQRVRRPHSRGRIHVLDSSGVG